MDGRLTKSPLQSIKGPLQQTLHQHNTDTRCHIPGARCRFIPGDDGAVPVLHDWAEDVDLIAATVGVWVRSGIHPTKYPQLMAVQCRAVVGSRWGFAVNLSEEEKSYTGVSSGDNVRLLVTQHIVKYFTQ